ncbi:MAG TPA: prepilin-type N-terminal cleavage/methylation domain-containing protein, partial [Thiotrichaceae bacterium]|nr:prepilin-type N-terminal cleavage/methylation domain-containing protein [Thiotrichaceae bacterium]
MQTKVENTANLEMLLGKPAIKPLLDKLYLYRINTKGELYWGMVEPEFVMRNENGFTLIEVMVSIA